MHELHNNLPFLCERIKIEKVKKNLQPTCTIKINVIHIRNLKQGLNHGLLLKKVYSVIKVNEKAWLKSDIKNEHLRK